MRNVQTIRGCDLTGVAADAPAEVEPAAPCLILVSGALPGAVFRLEDGVCRVGRAAENTLPLTDPDVSRHHATLWLDPSRRAWLTDLCSTNGTWHNGQRLAPQAPTEVRPGDHVRFGNSATFRLAALDARAEAFQRALYDRSVRDPLTGLNNRAFFRERIQSLARQAADHDLGLAVLMIDVDHFKRVNDAHGHEAGDDALRHVAAVLRTATRKIDLVARYGGEEFIVAFVVAGTAQAIAVAERIRLALSATDVPTDRCRLRLTASIGVAFLPPGRSMEPAPAIAAADRCLYRAKAEGRDRVVVDVVPDDPAPSGRDQGRTDPARAPAPVPTRVAAEN